jgi:hypothetical protein
VDSIRAHSVGPAKSKKITHDLTWASHGLTWVVASSIDAFASLLGSCLAFSIHVSYRLFVQITFVC